MKRKGFTLVELLGVIIILIIVLGIAVVGYIKIQDGIKHTYYHSQEDSILLAATEYYNYNENKIPKIFGDAEKISLQELISSGYIENVLDRNKNDCDLNSSSVIAYRDSYEKIQYEVCLVCPNDKYKTENDCETKTIEDYGLKVKATIGDTKREYKEGTWVNQDVWLTFTTGNDVNTVTVKGTTTGTKSCTLKKTNGLKTCKIKIDTKDTYTIIGYGNNSKTTEAQNKTILIDKVKPTYIVEDPTGAITRVSHTNDEYVIDFGSDTVASANVSTSIKDIEDTLSGIEGIRYSLEKQGSNDKYTILSINNNETSFTRTLTNGTWILKVEVRDIAGNLTTKTIKYHMYKKIKRPTESYCDNKIYNGSKQTITTTAPTGVKFENTTGTDAKNYTVKAELKEYYAWEDGERRNNQTFDCKINPRTLKVNAKAASRKYGEANPTFEYTYSNNVSGQTPKFSGALTTSATATSNVGTYDITQGTLKLVDNGTFKASNYTISYTKASLTISKANATNPTLTAYSGTYDGKSHTITVSGGTGGTVQYSTDNSNWSTTKPTRTNAGTTTVYVRVEGDSNHNTPNSINAKITINRADASCNISSVPTLTYPGSKTGSMNYSCTGDGNVTTSSSDTSVVSTNGVNLTANSTGTATVTVNQAQGTNYKAASSSKSITIAGTKYTATLDANGGSIDGKTSKAISVTYGSTVNLGSYTSTRTGYTFDGWYGVSGTKYTSFTWKFTTNDTFYAHWTAKTYTATLDANGGSIDGKTSKAISVTYGSTVNLGSYTPTRTGYTFDGWYGASGTKYTSFTWNFTTNDTFYAHWTAKTYTVTYNGNGGTYNGSSTWADTTKATYNQNYTTYSNNNFFVRAGYTFKGWNEKADGSGTDWTNYINKQWKWTYDHDVTLYAQWTANKYTVTYNGNGGTYNGSGTWTDPTKATYNQNYTTYSNNNFYVRKGYTFKGWNDEADGSGVDWTNWINKPWKWVYTKNVTLYAQWEPITYYIRYHGNGGVGSTGSATWTSSGFKYGTTYAKGTIIEPNWFVRNGYYFTGWKTKAGYTGWPERYPTNGSVEWKWVDGEYGIGDETTHYLDLYAQWAAATTPQITFEKEKKASTITTTCTASDGVKSLSVAGTSVSSPYQYNLGTCSSSSNNGTTKSVSATCVSNSTGSVTKTSDSYKCSSSSSCGTGTTTYGSWVKSGSSYVIDDDVGYTRTTSKLECKQTKCNGLTCSYVCQKYTRSATTTYPYCWH